MRLVTILRLSLFGVLVAVLLPAVMFAQQSSYSRVENTGASGLWILANISFAGMRAQGHPSLGWKIVAFLFGFPGTLLSLLVVPAGRERAYGVVLRRGQEERPEAGNTRAGH